MPTSLMFVGLAAAWLVVLVPMVARRRQEIARTADSALNARVLRRGGNAPRSAGRVPVATARRAGSATSTRVKEVFAMPDSDIEEYDEEELEAAYAADHPSGAGEPRHDYAEDDDSDYAEDEHHPSAAPQAAHDAADPADFADDEPEAAYPDEHYVQVRQREYRPGRGGFDPEVAERTARAKYAARQRLVVILLVLAVLTGLLAGLVLPALWWAHAAVDLTLVGYLTYLRRQVRIEEAIRQRRLARMTTARPRPSVRPPAAPAPSAAEHDDELEDEFEGEAEPVEEEPVSALPPVARLVPAPVVPGTTRLELDDEDPAFAELDAPGTPHYRRAVGE